MKRTAGVLFCVIFLCFGNYASIFGLIMGKETVNNNFMVLKLDIEQVPSPMAATLHLINRV